MWLLLLGCGPTAAEHEALAAANARLADLQARLTALEEKRSARVSRRTRPRPTGTTAPRTLADTRTLREILADPSSASRHGRFLLHQGADGRDDGYRLSALRRRGIADRLGIRNGDIVHSVNGLPLRSVDEARAVLESIDATTETLEVVLTRRGASLTLALPLDTPPAQPSP